MTGVQVIREYFRFLFTGPLFSILEALHNLKVETMGLKETLQGYNERLGTITEELREDFKRLNDKISETPVAEDVSEELAALDAKIGALEGLDQPDPETVPAEQPTPVTVVDPASFSTPNEATFASPGEPDAPSDDVLPEGE